MKFDREARYMVLEYWGKDEHLWWRQNGTRKEWKEKGRKEK